MGPDRRTGEEMVGFGYGGQEEMGGLGSNTDFLFFLNLSPRIMVSANFKVKVN